MSIWAEIWTRPGDASFGRVIDYLPSTQLGLHDGLVLVGDGNAAVADTFDRFDEILRIDPTTPGSSVSSLVRYFSDSDPTTPIFEWLPQLVVPRSEKEDRTVEIVGKGIKQILGYARTEPLDWDGTDDFVSRDPDWIYGGEDRIRNGGLEDAPLGISNQGFEDGTREPWWPGAVEGVSANASVQTVTVDTGTYALAVTPLLAEGGTSTTFTTFGAKEYTVTARFRGAAGVDYQIGCSGPDNMVAASPAAIVEHSTGGTYGPGHQYEAQDTFTASGAWETITLTFTTAPGQTISQLSIREGEAILDGSVFYVDVVTVAGFGIGVDPWQPTDGLIQNASAEFEASSAQAKTGTYSLKITAPDGNGGFHTLNGIKPGVTYTAGVSVGFASASSTWALEVRDVQGTLLGQASATIGTGAFSDLAVTFTVPDFVPGSRGEITVAVINYGGTIRTGYADDLFFYQGMQPATVGEILGDLYADATTDHSAVRVVWEDDANPGTAYLTLDFSDTLDSAGVAWIEDIRLRIWMRMSFLEVVEQLERSWGYEFRVVPNNVEAGTWLLQAYNPGTMKTDYTASASPAIQGGSSDTRRLIRRFLPATDYMVEGEERITSRDRDADLVSALGRIESSRLDRELPQQEAIIAAAFEDKVDAIPNSASYDYTLVNPQDEPLTDYVIGDLLTIHDPPDVEDEARLVEIVGSFTPNLEEWEVSFAPATTVGS